MGRQKHPKAPLGKGSPKSHPTNDPKAAAGPHPTPQRAAEAAPETADAKTPTTRQEARKAMGAFPATSSQLCLSPLQAQCRPQGAGGGSCPAAAGGWYPSPSHRQQPQPNTRASSFVMATLTPHQQPWDLPITTTPLSISLSTPKPPCACEGFCRSRKPQLGWFL